MAATDFFANTKHRRTVAALRHHKRGENKTIPFWVIMAILIFFLFTQLKIFSTFEAPGGGFQQATLQSARGVAYEVVWKSADALPGASVSGDDLSIALSSSQATKFVAVRHNLPAGWKTASIVFTADVKLPGAGDVCSGEPFIGVSSESPVDVGSEFGGTLEFRQNSVAGYRLSANCGNPTGLSTAVKTGTLIFKRNPDESVDSFVKQCASCAEQYLGTGKNTGKLYYVGYSWSSGGETKTSGSFQKPVITEESAAAVNGTVGVAPPVECVANADCWFLKQSCGYSCYNSKCDVVLTTAQAVLCSDNETLVGTYPVCSTAACPVPVIDSTGNITFLPVATQPPLTDATGVIPITPSEDAGISNTALIIGGIAALAFLLRFLG